MQIGDVIDYTGPTTDGRQISGRFVIVELGAEATLRDARWESDFQGIEGQTAELHTYPVASAELQTSS